MALKKKGKSIQTMKDSGELSKSHTYTDLIDKESYIFFPEKDAWRKRLIYAIEKWVLKETSVELMQFCIEYRIPRATLAMWRQKHLDIAAAFEEAKIILGCRRRIGALTKQYDKDVVFKDMHVYDPEWDIINKYHAQLKKDEDRGPVKFTINVTKPQIVSAEDMKAGKTFIVEQDDQ
jgi:hypothetical protein